MALASGDLALQGAVALKSCPGMQRMIDCDSAQTIQSKVSLSLMGKTCPLFDVEFKPFCRR